MTADAGRTAFSVIVSRMKGKVGAENCAKPDERTLLKRAKRMSARMGVVSWTLAVVEMRSGLSDTSKPRKRPVIAGWE